MRVLITGWPSFVQGEATAGDVLSMRRVRTELTARGIESDTAWSPNFVPDGLSLAAADPARYTHMIFVCGPVHGGQVRELHQRFAHCVRVAVGVSVLDPEDRAVTGFHRVLPRDGGGPRPTIDLAAAAPADEVPVVGVLLAPGQAEYGARGRHADVHAALTGWVGTLDCARLPLDTRLAAGDWRHCARPDELLSILARLDAVLTTRLHGLVLALHQGVPALAVDPVRGGGKVSAQAEALGWPAVIGADEVEQDGLLDHWWAWCLSPAGRAAAAEHGGHLPETSVELLVGVLAEGQAA